MALPLAWSAEGGSDGTTLTTGNSGGASGDAFDAVTIGSGAVLRYESDQAAHESLSLFLDQPASALPTYAAWTTKLSSPSELWGRLYLYMATTPPGGRVMELLSGGNERCSVRILPTTREVAARNSFGLAETSTGVGLPLNQWNRIEFHARADSTNNGIIEVRQYHTKDGTSIDGSASRTAQDFGTSGAATFDTIRFGDSQGGANDCLNYFDDFQVNATDWPGPVASTQYVSWINAGHHAPFKPRTRLHRDSRRGLWLPENAEEKLLLPKTA